MSRIWIVAAILSLVSPLTGVAQSSAQTANLSSSASAYDSNTPSKDASGTTHYAQLASYFHQQEAKYLAQAAAEKIERDRRARINAGLMQRYPRPVDSAQYLYASYLESADHAALEARHYEQLAGDAPQSLNKPLTSQ